MPPPPGLLLQLVGAPARDSERGIGDEARQQKLEVVGLERDVGIDVDEDVGGIFGKGFDSRLQCPDDRRATFG